MTCPDRMGQQSIQRHRLVLLAGILVVEEKVLLVSGLPAKKGMILHGSVILDEEEKTCALGARLLEAHVAVRQSR